MPGPSVVILGAGLAGLTLGRCLRHKGVSSIIYDRSSSTPRHTYGITLQPWAYKPLLDVLGLDESTFRRRLAVDSADGKGVGRVSAGDAPTSTPFRANRSKFESMLREGLNIHFEHSLSSARILENDGKAELTFDGGKKLFPDVVVDATGVHSKFRKSLLPNIEPEVHPFAVYSGKRYLDSNTYTSTYASAFKDGNMIVYEPQQADDPRLEITVNDRQANGTVSISYIYSRPARNDDGVDRLHNPDRPQTDATKIPDEFYEEVDRFIRTRNPGTPFNECFNVDRLRSDRILHWLMRTVMVPKQELLLSLPDVVLIGDSVHAVPILGGEGANMAIVDAIRLAEALGLDSRSMQVKDFYEKSWSEWHNGVEASKKALVEMHQADNNSTANL